MTNIELYINNRRCDIDRNFGVRLNRRLIKPGELNTKDAQYSFSITLPPTERNHKIFNYANIEETSDKFNREYRTELIINGVRVFKGLFRLSEISRGGYKGNLYVPAAKSAKDIFGDLKLNENPEWRMDFGDFAESVSRRNRLATTGPQEAIFPYTLYGVLPKVPLADGKYSDRDIWDDTVRMGMQDLPPSINPLKLLKHIFQAKKYTLGGTAFNDERLTNLYMSYKNDPGYVQPWNYGLHSIRLSGEWASTYNKRTGSTVRELERGVKRVENDQYKCYGCDIFNATNTFIDPDKFEDNGGNVLYETDTDDNGRTWARCQVRIPASGFYKIQLKAELRIPNGIQWEAIDYFTNIQHTSVISGSYSNNMSERVYEFRLLRDWGKGDFGLSSAKLDGTFYRNNQDQNNDNNTDAPKYFPEVNDKGQINFIDAAQDKNVVVGFGFGRRGRLGGGYQNQGDIGETLAQIHAAKPSLSWDSSLSETTPTRLAVKSPGYRKYGRLDNSTIGWEGTDKYKIDLNNAPDNSAKKSGFYDGKGSVNAVVWFEAGELLTLASVSEEGRLQVGNETRYGWVEHEVAFDLSIQPFRADGDWLKVDLSGKGTAEMDWDDAPTFDIDAIDLVKFLPADMKTDDFIDNFCKAFNLRLTQTGEKAFELNVKQSRAAVSNLFINLDNLASVRDRSNTPLGLPSLYKLGFTVDAEEEGYVTTEEDGGGEFETGATEEKIVEQKSNFSFNWFKAITKQQPDGNIDLPLAVISKHEVWEESTLYPDAMKKRYTNQALRFWYADGLLNDLGATFEFNKNPLAIVKVSNELPGLSILSYENRKLTILNNYFTLLINGGSHYTETEGYLTPDQYERLNGSIMAMFNGDLYYVAEMQGYDPTGRNKTKIKLIRKI